MAKHAPVTKKKKKSGRTVGGQSAPGGIAFACVVAILIGVIAVILTPQAATRGGRDCPLRISEVMSANGSTLTLKDGSLPDWIEIENTSGQVVDLTGFALLTESNPTDAFAFPSGTLAPGAFVVVYCDGSGKSVVDGEYHAPFRLSASGEKIALINKRGVGVDMVEVPSLERDQVYCRDASGAWQISDYPTPGIVNRAERAEGETAGERSINVVPGIAEISEVMTRSVTFFPDENGNCTDYIEVHNISGAPLNLEGWALSDARDKLGKWKFPSVTLPADGYIAVHCTGVDDTSDTAHLHASLKLSKDGEDLYLTDANGVVRTHVKVPALAADQAYVKMELGWSKIASPSPGKPNTLSGAAEADAQTLSVSKALVITEVLASSNKSDDWIEILNRSSSAIDLSGYGLSDNAARPRKWQFPNGTVIQPGQYLGVFANGTNQSDSARLCTNFRLSAEGGYSVTLSDAGGNILDRLFVPDQYQNISFGRTNEGDGLRYYASPTPGSANGGESYYGRAPQPVYSVRGGMYKTGEVLTVTLTVPSDCRVYYTLDSTDPDEADTLYTAPIQITGTTILRTRTYGSGYMPSVMDAQSYLFDVNNGDGAVYVMSLVSDPYNLTSDEAGIMVKGPNALVQYPYGSMNKGANFWMDWEREGHIEVFDLDGSTMISQECGVKLHGQYSRAEKQKAFKIIARKEYGSGRFQASIFSRRPYTEYQSFLLRTTSQDGNKVRMRDALLQRLAEGLDLMYQETEIGILYIDGKYWGHYNLRERVNPASICQWEGWEGEEDDIDLVKANTNVMQGSNETMEKLLNWVKNHDMNTDEAYQVLDSAIDIQNYIQYMAIEMYTGNTDTLNVKRYRNAKRDGKWRWVLFDLDWGFHEDTNSVRRWLAPGGMGNQKRTDNSLFIACMKNDRFRDEFLTFLGEKMATTFSAESIRAMAEEYSNTLMTILPDHMERWEEDMKQYTDAMKTFLKYNEARPKRMLQFLKYAENLHLTENEMEKYFGGTLSTYGVSYADIKEP